MSKYHCCKPFHDTVKRCSPKLRVLTDQIIEKLNSVECKVHLDTSLKICDTCRLHAYRLCKRVVPEDLEKLAAPSSVPVPGNSENLEIPSTSRYELEEVPSATSLVSTTSQDSDLPDYAKSHNIELFNSGISGINVSPISAKQFQNVTYRRIKYSNIMAGIRKNLFSLPQDEDDEELQALKTKAAAYDEIISKLKEKFIEPDCSRFDKIRILTVLPDSWSVQKIADTFETNKYIASQAKVLAAQHGVMAVPENKSGNPLDPAIKNEVLQFYDDDDISRPMPGQRDYVSVKKDNGKRQQVQKRLLLSSLRETFNRFNELSKCKVGFSTFASLRPKHCKLLNASGSHNVCVCTFHENFDLMLHSLKKFSFMADHKQYFEKILCDSSLRSKNCYLRECPNCPSLSEFELSFLDELEQHNLSEISFEQWLTTDRCNLETVLKPVDEFAGYFSEKLEKLLTHDYIKNKQAQFLKDTKSSLKEGEVAIICDFSENYSFVLQDAVQSHHWNNDQATIHPFVVYYKESGVLKNLSYVVISEVLKHDTIAVQVFISKLLTYLNQKFDIKKAVFMSDGAASQYKNRKNFFSLCKFKEKYNIDSEWHFFATSHGKGPSDAIGGTLKRMATRASLARQHEHPITNAKTLYDWACKRHQDNFTTISFCYVSQEEYDEGAIEWGECYQQAKMIPGTQKYHSFIPISNHKIAAKLFSTDEEQSSYIVCKNVKK